MKLLMKVEVLLVLSVLLLLFTTLQIVKGTSCYRCIESTKLGNKTRGSCLKHDFEPPIVHCSDPPDKKDFCYYARFLYAGGGGGARYDCIKMSQESERGEEPQAGFSQCFPYETEGAHSEQVKGTYCFCYGDKCNDPKTANSLIENDGLKGQSEGQSKSGDTNTFRIMSPRYVLANTLLMLAAAALLF